MSQSVRPADGGLTLNVDVANVAVYEELPVPALITAVLGLRDSQLGSLDTFQHRKVKSLLMTKQVDFL